MEFLLGLKNFTLYGILRFHIGYHHWNLLDAWHFQHFAQLATIPSFQKSSKLSHKDLSLSLLWSYYARFTPATGIRHQHLSRSTSKLLFSCASSDPLFRSSQTNTRCFKFMTSKCFHKLFFFSIDYWDLICCYFNGGNFKAPNFHCFNRSDL